MMMQDLEKINHTIHVWLRHVCCLTMLLVVLPISAQNNPYVDDRLFHFGFSLGVNLMSYGVQDSQEELNGEIYHARVSNLMPGFNVGFITDLRLARYLSLRFLPSLSFSSRTLKYKTESGNKVEGSPGNGSTVDVLTIPISIPLFLKWSAEREKNYRPYVIVGGGASYNVSTDREKPVAQRGWDGFVEAGFGCDFYFSWFKLCPEIRYQIGFANQLMPLTERPEVPDADLFYTKSIGKLTNQSLSIIFNFE